MKGHTDKDLQRLFNKLNKKFFDDELIEISAFFIPNQKDDMAGGFVVPKEGNVYIAVIDRFKRLHKNNLFHIVLHEMVHYWLYTKKQNVDHTIPFYDKLLECYKKAGSIEVAWQVVLVGMQEVGFLVNENGKKKCIKIKMKVDKTFKK